MEELKKYYEKIIESGKFYKGLIQISPRKSNIALQIQATIDEIEYLVKLYFLSVRKKRKVTDDEKEMLMFLTPKIHTLENFHSKGRYPVLSENLKKLIVKIKEREERKNDEKNSIIDNNIDDDNNPVSNQSSTTRW